MIFLREAPAPESDKLQALYQRLPLEGMVHSSAMQGERYDRADAFDDSLACAALTWSAGGEERYEFDRNTAITVKSAGALSLAAGARYAYAAHGAHPFWSNMIVFPHWITAGAACDPLTGRTLRRQALETRLFQPSQEMNKTMSAIAQACRGASDDDDGADEALALLYRMLIDTQDARYAEVSRLDAAKPSTREELARRAARAKTFILQSYDDPELTLGDIAREACLSPFHLVRVFNKLTGDTPMQFLKTVRVNAAHRLLCESKFSVAEAACATGYRDRSAFYRAFVKHFAMAPSAMRR